MAVVTNVTSLTRSGLADFLVQRVTAVIIALYALCVFGFFLANPDLSHSVLIGYFGSTAMKLFSTVTVLACVGHAWIGMWTIGTDYIRQHYFGEYATTCRFFYQGGCLLVLFLYTAWALPLFWGL
ncbi:MAG: succinate dehydrogenase, hydrophobic membrane anchor protein [Gammaproteobacteria bacterium]|nr:succinate dehydrogenase, hydrophobic membrane anchor protein [Gammaproteobacteria bacterium]